MNVSMHKYWWYAICFFTGMISLILEITGLRILAPSFGNSLYMTGTVINTVLFGLAAGYYAGGWLSAKKQSEHIPFLLLLFSSLYLSIVYSLKSYLFSFALQLPFIAAVLLASAALLFLPMFLLGFISPYIIGLGQEHAGMKSGKVFSISTLGSIVGGILTTFLLIPSVGSRIIMLGCIVVLGVVGCIGLFGRSKKYALLLLLVGMPLLPNEDNNYVLASESPYNLIYVKELFGKNILLLNDNRAMHSTSLDPATGLSFAYYDYFLIPNLLHETKSTLILGNGAGTAMTEILHFFPGRVDGVEIDEELTRIGEKYFGLDVQNSKSSIFHMDARVFLAASQEKYDAIDIDLFSGSAYVPAHLVTKEFFTLAYEHLSDNGIIVINMFSVFKNKPMGNSYIHTIAQVFPSVFITDTMIYAFKTPTTKEELVKKMESAELSPELSYARNLFLKNLEEISIFPNAIVFTDDYAPIEPLIFSEIRR